MGGRSAALVGLVAALAAGACDDPFSPVARSDVHFSVFGYLDASADTQWVRVMPVRTLKVTSPDSFGITVILEHVASGRTTELRDSVLLFTHHLDPELGSEGAYLHNFWTTEKIEPGATYRFSARRNGDLPAEAVVEIPSDYEVEVWLRQNLSVSDSLRILGLKHAPFVDAYTYLSDRCGANLDSVRFKERSVGQGVQVIPIRKATVPPREGCGSPRIERRELRVVGSEVEWPSGQAFSPWALAVPEGLSNVTNAVGFLGGVVTKVIPYETCTFQGGAGASLPSHCRLRYGPASAGLRGIVTETRCNDGALDSVSVELREMDGEPPAARRVRTTFSSRRGAFEIGALEAGVRYALKVRAKPEIDPFWGEIDIHTLHFDTLVFAPGEQRPYDVELQRFTECGSSPGADLPALLRLGSPPAPTWQGGG